MCRRRKKRTDESLSESFRISLVERKIQFSPCSRVCVCVCVLTNVISFRIKSPFPLTLFSPLRHSSVASSPPTWEEGNKVSYSISSSFSFFLPLWSSSLYLHLFISRHRVGLESLTGYDCRLVCALVERMRKVRLVLHRPYQWAEKEKKPSRSR